MMLAVVTGALVHVVLPLSILTGVAVRQNVLSFFHLLLLLLVPILPAVTSRGGVKQKTLLHLRACLAFGTAFAVGGALFQLLCFTETISTYEPCNITEEILRLIGLVSYKSIPARDVMRLITPDILVALLAALSLISSNKLNENVWSDRTSSPLLDHIQGNFWKNPYALNIFTQIACVGILGTLLFVGAIRPSVTSAVYYISFLGLGTAWACKQAVNRRMLGIFCRFIAFYAGLHAVVLFVYQTQWFQEVLQPGGFYSRLFGLIQIVNATCVPPTQEHPTASTPGILRFVDADWDYFVNPVAILTLYFAAAALGPLLCALPVDICLQLLKGDGSSGSRRLNYQTITSNGMDGDVAGGGDITDVDGIDSDHSAAAKDTGSRMTVGPSERTPFAEFVVQPMLLFVAFVVRSCYVGTLIIMMAWSITYHSWLTFVLLLWACILWMVPNQRKATQRNTPFLIIYGELLVVGQYLYGMDLTEAELPSVVNGWKMGQIGFIRHEHLPVGILVAEGLYLAMFWATMRQWLHETWEKRQHRTVVTGDVEEGSLEGGNASGSAAGDQSLLATTFSPDNTGDRSAWTFILGQWFRRVMAKIWIWVVAIMLCVIGIGSGEVVIYRIVYTAFFLFFVSTFQISYGLWRKVMYGFWLVVIIFSMIVLIAIYTYQFDDFPMYWSNYTGMPVALQHDLGLEQYGVGELFLRLLTPTFFVIITIIQVHYFHADFLKSTDYNALPGVNEESHETDPDGPKSPDVSHTSRSTAAASHRTREPDALGISDVKEYFATRLPTILATSRRVFRKSAMIFWRLLEIHVTRILLFSCVLLAAYDVCACHAILVLMVALGTRFGPRGQDRITHGIVLIVSGLLLARMIYQIEYVDEHGWVTNCTTLMEGVLMLSTIEPTTEPPNVTIATNSSLGTAYLFSAATLDATADTTDTPEDLTIPSNNAEWLGFTKNKNLPYHVRGYIGLLVVLTLHGVCRTRQRYRQERRRADPLPPGVVFPEITREKADDGLISCAKYLVNYAFYKFGVEITLITIVGAIAAHLDIIGCMHAIWLLTLFSIKRRSLRKVWAIFSVYLMVIIIVQYVMLVGLPPALCFEYPWTSLKDPELIHWLYLPTYSGGIPLVSTTIIADFVVLLMVVAQSNVFWIELTDPNYPGGCNGKLSDAELTKLRDPALDYVTYTRNYLDMIKKIVFFFFFWTTLAIVFMAGNSQISLFGLGYVVGTFIFLWMGNGLFLKPLPRIWDYWKYLIFYNITVILVRASLQVVACVYHQALYGLPEDKKPGQLCPVAQLLGISCLWHLHGRSFNPPTSMCNVTSDEASFLWDGLCLAFLLFQKRIFRSFYFQHVVNELRAQHTLASLGAQLLRELTQKKIKSQKHEEEATLEKIRDKTKRIRDAWEKHKGKPQEPKDHYEAIRSGDYYMFEDSAEPDGLSQLEKSESPEKEQEPGMTVTQLMSSAMKSNMEQAMHEAKLKRAGDSTSEFSLSRQTSVVSSRMRSGPPSPTRYAGPSIPEELEQEVLEKSVSDGEKGGGDAVDGAGASKPPVEDEADVPGEDRPAPPESFIRRLVRYIRFGWQLIESSMVSATAYLNKVSADYRYMARVLQKEKRARKKGGHMSDESTDGYHPLATPDAIRSIIRGKTVIPTVRSAPEIRVAGPSSEDDFGGACSELRYRTEILDEEERFEREKAPPVRLLYACWYAAISRSELLCYFFMCLNQLKSASILSLPLPFMAFLWGTLSIPRPTRRFWVTAIGYTEFVIFIKYVFQFNFYPWSDRRSTLDTEADHWLGIFGLEQKADYAIYDLILLMSLFFHRFMLKSVGLWKKDGEIATVMSPQPSTPASEPASDEGSMSPPPPTTGDGFSTPEQMQEERSPTNVRLKLDLTVKGKKVGKSMKKFFKTIDEPPYQVKADVYAPMFMCDFINFLVLVFGFNAFGGTSGDGGVSAYLEENKVPVAFLILLIVQFACIVIDRALYLKKWIFGKLIFQYFQVIMVHMWMFFILPAVTDNKFGHNTAPQVYYFVKCIYFLLSAYQIRCGYPTRILGNVLCKKYNYINMILFKGFTLIPFLYELRAVMDWMWTYTSLSLFDWLKMEDIYAQIFQLKCQRRAEAEYPLPRGESRTAWFKYGMGGAVLALIIAIVWFPLVLFALANTVGIPNQPNYVTVEISVGAYQPLFQMSAQHSALIPFSGYDYNKLRSFYNDSKPNSREAQFFLTTYDNRDVVVAQLNGKSTGIWTVSPPSLARLMDDLKSGGEMSAKFTWSIQRTTPGSQAAGIISGEQSKPLTNSSREALLAALNSTEPRNITLHNLMPKFLRVSSKGEASFITQLSENDTVGFRSLNLTLQRGTWPLLNTSAQWWEVKEECPPDDPLAGLPLSPDCNYLRMYIFSDKVFPSTLTWLSAGGIIGMYISVVLVVGKVFRVFFVGLSFTIMFEDMPNVDRVLQLCLDIYLVRESGALDLEEDLFAKLIFLYRSPETLIKWTYPSSSDQAKIK